MHKLRALLLRENTRKNHRVLSHFRLYPFIRTPKQKASSSNQYRLIHPCNLPDTFARPRLIIDQGLINYVNKRVEVLKAEAESGRARLFITLRNQTFASNVTQLTAAIMQLIELTLIHPGARSRIRFLASSPNVAWSSSRCARGDEFGHQVILPKRTTRHWWRRRRLLPPCRRNRALFAEREC